MRRPSHLLMLLVVAQSKTRPIETVGSIDFLGLRRVTESEVRAVLDLKEGDQGQMLPAQAAAAQGLLLEVIKLPQAKRAFVLLPCRWVVERPFDWAARFRRLARDYERLASSLPGLHWIAFVTASR